jgi:hypothetical protein
VNSARFLLDLQATDQQLAMRRRAYRGVAVKLEAEGGVPGLTEAVEKARVRELEARLEVARLEQELAVVKEEVERLETRLYSGAITNVRELTAIETEHTAARRKLAQVDEAIGPSQVAAEEAKQRHLQLKKDLADRQVSWKSEKQELMKEKRRIGREYQAMGKEREKATDGIPSQDLALYSSLLPTKGGVAVVTVDRGVCQGCHVRLPVGEIARMRNTENIVSCPSCGRILLVE